MIGMLRRMFRTQDCSGKPNKVKLFFPYFWPNPGPGGVPLDSGRGDVEFAGVCASVASVAVGFVSEFIIHNSQPCKI